MKYTAQALKAAQAAIGQPLYELDRRGVRDEYVDTDQLVRDLRNRVEELELTVKRLVNLTHHPQSKHHAGPYNPLFS